MSPVKVGFWLREFEKLAVAPAGPDVTDHWYVNVCATPQATSASEGVALSWTAVLGCVVPGVAVAVTVGDAAPQLPTVTVNVFGWLERPVESFTVSRTT